VINHLRTLLLNRDGTPAVDPSLPGEEYVPPRYKAAVLPAALRPLSSLLFGVNPDRVFLNARLRQYLILLQVCRLDQSPDTRLSYDECGGGSLYDAFAAGVRTSQSAGPAGSWIQTIVHTLPRARNRLQRSWRLSVIDGSTAAIEWVGDDGLLQNQTFAYSVENGAASLPLPDMDITVLFPATSGAAWLLSTTARPDPDLAELIQQTDSLLVDSPAATLLFADQPELRRYASNHPAGPYRLAAVLRALALLTDTLRGGPQ
jgi:hypothetical protein